MAATALKLGKIYLLSTHIRKLQFEVVVLIDCMFYAYNVEDVFKFEILTLHEPKKKMAANKFKMVATEFK